MKKAFFIFILLTIGCYPVSYIRGNSSLILKESSSFKNEKAIGCILPLTGKYSTFGKKVLYSILLSARIFKEEGYPIELIIKDSKGDPYLAASCVDDLARNEKVIGIIGGLLSSTVEMTVKRAEEKKIPIIVLSQKEDIRWRGEYTFRNCLTNSLMVKSIAKFSINNLGLKKFVILHPENPYGETIMKLFSTNVKEFGGDVVSVLKYSQNQTDFKEHINILKKLKSNIDSIFIPDYYNKIAVILPQMKFYELNKVQLLGYIGWNSKKLIKLAKYDIEGSIFVDGLYKEDQKTKEFLNEYLSTYGEEAGIIEAQTYDSIGIIINISENNSVKTRQGLRKELSKIKNYPGITGLISSNIYGDMERNPFILKFEGGDIIKIK